MSSGKSDGIGPYLVVQSTHYFYGFLHANLFKDFIQFLIGKALARSIDEHISDLIKEEDGNLKVYENTDKGCKYYFKSISAGGITKKEESLLKIMSVQGFIDNRISIKVSYPFTPAIVAGLLIAVFYIFYRLLLARETFHRVNRIVLLLTAVASFVLPLCVITMHRTVVMPMPTIDVELGSAVAADLQSGAWPLCYRAKPQTSSKMMERETSLELATSTLARLRSTN